MSFEPIEYTDDFERWWEVYWEFSPIFNGLYKTVAFHAWTAALAQPERRQFTVGDVVEGVLVELPDDKRRGKFLGFDKAGNGVIQDDCDIAWPWFVSKDTLKLIEPAKRHAHNPDGEA